MSATLDFLLSRLHGVTRNGDGFTALCPAHEDRRPSLSVRDGEKAVLVKCHAGCTAEAVVAELGLTMHELFFNSPANSNGNGTHAQPPRIVATYDYTDENGTLVYQNVRYEPKTFRQRRPNGKGGWSWNLDGVRRVLYHLPVVLTATEVLVLEGEKDVEKARSLGLCATTCGSASNPWLAEYTGTLTGKAVAVIADADEPGREKARKIEQALLGQAKSVRVLEMPGAKDLSEWIEQGGTREQLLELVDGTPESKLESTDGAVLLDTILAIIRRFVSLSEAQARALALWVVHTHVADAADTTPYLAINSPAKRSGKTRLLEILRLIVANAWMTGRVTAAALVRKIDKEHPTLLLDESDAAFKGDREYAEALRGVLNCGHERGGKASLCVGQGANIEVKDFGVFCPKAIAGIGRLPDTVADRAIPIRLKRKTRSEPVERFRRRDVEPEAEKLFQRIARWTAPLIDTLRDARPSLPAELTDRQQDGVEPLLAIADAAGGNWPESARRAFVQLCLEARDSDHSDGERLLADIHQILETRTEERFQSADLVESLLAIDASPWCEYSNGKPLSQAKLARLLHPFGIFPTSIRIEKRTPKGYMRSDFEDAFERYLAFENPPSCPDTATQSATVQQANTGAGSSDFSKCNRLTDVAVPKLGIANTGAGCCTVALSNAPANDGELETRKGR